MEEWRVQLRSAVERSGRKHAAIAYDAGIAPETLSRVLNASHARPAFGTVVRIAHAAGHSVAWLLGERGFLTLARSGETTPRSRRHHRGRDEGARMKSNPRLADRLRIMRYRARLTQAQLAERAGMNPRTYATRETAERAGNLGVRDLERLVEACAISPLCFFQIKPTPEERAALDLDPGVWPNV
jgi:transcriptional regulator with XRE-family HTH domain